MNDSTCIPFRIPDLYGGFADGVGLLKCGKETLILDFEVKESIFETLKLDAKAVTLSLADVAAIDFKKGWFSRWIVLRTNRLKALEHVPGSNGGELRLKIHRIHEAEAANLVASVQMALTSQGVQRMLDNIHPRP